METEVPKVESQEWCLTGGTFYWFPLKLKLGSVCQGVHHTSEVFPIDEPLPFWNIHFSNRWHGIYYWPINFLRLELKLGTSVRGIAELISCLLMRLNRKHVETLTDVLLNLRLSQQWLWRVFCDVSPCITTGINWHYGETHRLHLQDWRVVGQSRKQQGTACACCLLLVGFLNGLLFCHEDIGSAFTRNVGRPPYHTSLHPKISISSLSPLRQTQTTICYDIRFQDHTQNANVATILRVPMTVKSILTYWWWDGWN